MFGLPYPYGVYLHSGGSVDHFYVELWHPELRKYVVGMVYPNGVFRPSNDHLLKREFKAAGSDF